MTFDYIIVGSGLAGIMFADILERNGRSFVVFEDGSQQSSSVAGGLYNPVVLKRLNPVWKAGEMLAHAMPVYKALEEKLDAALDWKTPIYRVLASIEEQNNWFQAHDRSEMKDFLAPEISRQSIKGINGPHGFGEVRHTGRVDTRLLVTSFRQYLRNQDRLITDSFDHDKLKLNLDGLQYRSVEASHIVFAEGAGLHQNPYFNHLPLVGNKGELLTIEAPELELDVILKAGVFIIPLGGHRFRVGATYNRKYQSPGPTPEARHELIKKLESVLKVPYTIVDHVAGIRPTVADRRPLVGKHPQYDRLFLLNGMGSRGVLIAPYAAQALYNLIEQDIPLDPTIDIGRFG